VSVTSLLTVKNVDYGQLAASPGLLSSFQEAMKRAIASAAGPGVAPEHVRLELSSGSVVVVATITPPSGVSTAAVQSQLESMPLSQAISRTVASVAGISKVSTGPISVSEVRVSAAADGDQERPFCGDAKSQRERETRRARRALEDAIVLASRIQLLRAEGARTRRRLQQAEERALEAPSGLCRAQAGVVRLELQAAGAVQARLRRSKEDMTSLRDALQDEVAQLKLSLDLLLRQRGALEQWAHVARGP